MLRLLRNLWNRHRRDLVYGLWRRTYDIIPEGLKMARLRLSDVGKTLCRGTKKRNPVILWLSAPTLLAFILRTVRLDLQPLWWDEGWSVYFATADIPSMLARTAVDIHPPLYYLVLHIWVLIVGPSPISVRLLSVLLGTLSIPMLFFLARRLFGVGVGLMAALTMAVAPFHIYYSQETRMYAFVTLLILYSMYLFLSLLQRQEASSSPIHWLLYIVVTSLAMYTQYYAVFIPISQTIFILVRIRRYKPLLARWVGAQIVLLLSYVPWVLYAAGKLVKYVATKMAKEGDVPLSLYAYLQQHLLAFSVGHLSQDRAFLSWLALVFIALVMLGIIGYLRYRPAAQFPSWRSGYAIAFFLIYLLVPLFLGYLVNLRYPFTSPGIQRLFLLSAPAFYLLVALGLTWLWKRFHALWPACLVLVAVSVPSLFDFYTVERYVGEDYRPLIQKVQALARPDDVIVAVHPWQIGYFHAYYGGLLPFLYLTPKAASDVTSEEWATDSEFMAQELDRLLLEHRFLWFPAHQALGRILEDDVEGYLSQMHYPLFSQWFSESTKLSCYAGAEDLNVSDERVSFGDKVSLLSYSLTSTPVEAAWGALRIDLRWKISTELDGRYQVALRLADEEGRTWAAQDGEPVGGLRPFHEQSLGSEMADHHGLLVPAGTPPGVYQIRLGLYRLEDGRWLDILDRAGAPQGVEAVLGPVEVLAPSSPPPLESLSIQHPRQADFAPGIRFLGYSLGGESFQPGDSLEIALFWQALTDLHEDYHLSLRMQDDAGEAWASVEGPLSLAAYPTRVWEQSQLVRGLQSLLIPARVSSGDYRLILSLYHTGDGRPLYLRRWGLNWGDNCFLGTIKVRGRPHQTEPPASIGHPTSLRLGEAVELLGYDLDRQQVSAGDSLELALYWQALSEIGTSYTVFSHLIDDQNRIWGQKDSIPGDGSLPTSSWLAGEYVIDEYEIPVRADAPSGEYLLEIGMYDLTTMIRLPVFDARGTEIGDRVLLEATPIYVGS